MIKTNHVLLGLLLVMSFVIVTTGYSQDSLPWSITSEFPIIVSCVGRKVPIKPARDKDTNNIFMVLLEFYQDSISPIDGDRCLMYPTCSQYSFEAIQKHNSFIGIIMTADRLIHESAEQDFATYVEVGNKYRHLDSIENNDFWWCED